MAFAITQTCCNDATCVSVCPVNCIHPTPEERAFGSTEMLHIDPKSCIDCGACADACPVDAVLPLDRLTGGQREYARINAAYFERDLPEETEPPARSGPNPRTAVSSTATRVRTTTPRRCCASSTWSGPRPASTPRSVS